MFFELLKIFTFTIYKHVYIYVYLVDVPNFGLEYSRYIVMKLYLKKVLNCNLANSKIIFSRIQY